MTRQHYLSIFILAVGALSASACSSDDPPTVGSGTEDLTAAQCTFFADGDTVQICHKTGSNKHPYTIIRTSRAGCTDGHAGHLGDYIASSDPDDAEYDPTCSGQGCYPEGAPFDGTVECCEGLSNQGGVCRNVNECAAPDNGGCGAGYTCTDNPTIGAPPICTDIDECADDTDDCDANASCTNTAGSFTCACNAGYHGDGLACAPDVVCGDGAIDASEQCDDGNTVDGDGCSATCGLENGWTCTGAPSVCTAAPCPSGGSPYGNHCYVVQPGDLGTDGSEIACQAYPGGHLASIHSQAENDFVGDLIDPTGQGFITGRIGGTAPGTSFCSGPDASYAWTDGSTWDYENWRRITGEPSCGDPAPGGIQLWPDNAVNRAGEFGFSYVGWNDVPPTGVLPNYVCEYPKP